MRFKIGLQNKCFLLFFTEPDKQTQPVFEVTHTLQTSVECSGTGVAEINDESTFSIYPQPANEVLNIYLKENNEKKFSFRIIDITGRELMKEKIENKNSFTVDVSTYPKGIYIIQLSSNKKTNCMKFLVE